jgi:hypothetical protein
MVSIYIMQEYVELDSNLVELFYGTDSALFEDMQHLCKCAIPSLTAVAELQNALAREEEASRYIYIINNMYIYSMYI